MDVHTNIPLKNYTTIKLGGPARFMADAHTTDQLIALLSNAKSRNIPKFILGGGSNVVAKDEGYSGLVIRIRIPGFEIINDDEFTTTIKIGAGESWDESVKKTVQMNLTGIETLSAIPGTAGAAPVQNIGAYGQEISETLLSLEAYDTQSEQIVTLTNEQCEFGYRHSMFRGSQQGRYVIINITLKLHKKPPRPPFYDALQDYLQANNITTYTSQNIRDAVIAIRADKLPDPSQKPNAGSFFKNAIIEDWQVNDLKQVYPDVKLYEMGNGNFKVPTGWLIEQTGLKGQLINGIRIHDKNSLVLINESATSYNDLVATRDQIIGAVRDKFRIQIEQEPLEI